MPDMTIQLECTVRTHQWAGERGNSAEAPEQSWLLRWAEKLPQFVARVEIEPHTF
jgi:hypothetical protein